MRSLLALLFAAVLLAQSPAGKPKLAYVVILSRHGVRSPIATNEALKQYAAEPWPNWSAPGELTEHGSKLMGILGGRYRVWLAQDGLVPAAGQRTRESGRAFVQGMFPGCPIMTHTVEAAVDPLFHPVPELAHGDAALAAAAVSSRIGNNPAALSSTLEQTFGTLREVLFGCAIGAPCPGQKQPGNQGLLDLPAAVGGTEDGLADIRGPVQTGSTLAENLWLEYAEGVRGKDLAWGRLDETRVKAT